MLFFMVILNNDRMYLVVYIFFTELLYYISSLRVLEQEHLSLTYRLYFAKK